MNARKLPGPLENAVRGYIACIESLLIVGMVAIVLVAVLQVFFRYVLGASLSWSEEALRYLMIWVTYLGVGLAYSRGEMIGMELLVSKLPCPAALVIGIVGRLLVVAMMLAILWYGWQFAWKTREATAVAIPISMFWIHISVAVGAGLVVVHIIASALATILRLEHAREATQ